MNDNIKNTVNIFLDNFSDDLYSIYIETPQNQPKTVFAELLVNHKIYSCLVTFRHPIEYKIYYNACLNAQIVKSYSNNFTDFEKVFIKTLKNIIQKDCEEDSDDDNKI